METSLHQKLKRIYAGDTAQVEVRLGGYRIDAVVEDELIEIQHGSLAAIRRKLDVLVQSHRVRVVKPLIARKTLVTRARKDGKILRRRASPKRASMLDIFHELIYLTRTFPHPNLAIEVPLVETEEWRYPGHGRRRRWRRNDYVVEDQRLVSMEPGVQLKSRADLIKLLHCNLPSPFHTGHLAEGLGIQRFFAQRIAYCLRKMGAAGTVGKHRNAILYEFCSAPQLAEHCLPIAPKETSVRAGRRKRAA